MRATQLSHRGRRGDRSRTGRIELARVNDDQVVAERDRALADHDAARVASETANREASITKRQRDEYRSRHSAKTAQLAQVQKELSSNAAMPSRIEVSTSIGSLVV